MATWAGADLASSARATITATAEAGGFVLRGASAPVEAAAQAQQLLITARTGTGLAQFLVPTSTAGVTVTPLHSLDLVRRFARVELHDVSVPAEALVGDAGRRHRRRAPAPRCAS